VVSSTESPFEAIISTTLSLSRAYEGRTDEKSAPQADALRLKPREGAAPGFPMTHKRF